MVILDGSGVTVCALPGMGVCGLCVPAPQNCPFSATGVTVQSAQSDLLIPNSW